MTVEQIAIELVPPGSETPVCIRGTLYRPPVRGMYRSVVVVVHGTLEHQRRYEEPAAVFVESGHLVLTFDLPGHGESCSSPPATIPQANHDTSALPLFLATVEAALSRARELESDLPLYLLGHGFGSLLGRIVASGEWGGHLHGAVFTGTAFHPGPLGFVGRKIIHRAIKRDGALSPATKVFDTTIGGYARSVRDAAGPFDWISRDQTVVRRYSEDPLCGFTPSLQLFEAVVQAVFAANDKSCFDSTSRELSMIFFSGSRDPVGSFGRGVMKVVKAYQKRGLTDLNVRIYPEARHELLHETNRAAVYADIIRWLNIRLDLREHIITHYP